MLSSGPALGGTRETADPDSEPAVHGTWGDPCDDHRSGFDKGTGRDVSAPPCDLARATTTTPRRRTAQSDELRRPAAGAGTAVILGRSGVIDPQTSRSTYRIRLLAQIELGIRALQLARRRSLLDVSPTDLQRRVRSEAVAARRRGQFAESARLAQNRRRMLAPPASPAHGNALGGTGNGTPETSPATPYGRPPAGTPAASSPIPINPRMPLVFQKAAIGHPR
jgi:hypothetical protein